MPVSSHELFVRPLLSQTATLQYEDAISATYGGESVRNEDHCLALSGTAALQQPLEKALFRVYR